MAPVPLWALPDFLPSKPAGRRDYPEVPQAGCSKEGLSPGDQDKAMSAWRYSCLRLAPAARIACVGARGF